MRCQFKVLAGDFAEGAASITDKEIALFSKSNKAGFATVRIADVKVPLSRIESVQATTEDAAKRVGGAVGWGTAGALVAGPAGLVAGAIMGGRGKDITFVVVLKDGRKFLAKGDAKAYEAFQKASFR